jgi:hypothetical protein
MVEVGARPRSKQGMRERRRARRTSSAAQSRLLGMANSNTRKRAAHRRRVQAALQEILNDPAVMPNADCADLIVSVSQVEFGRTVRDIFIDVLGKWRRSPDQWTEAPHDKYTREARAKGKDTYTDLTDVFLFPAITEVVARELQKRLGLLYTPVIRRLCDLGGA